jgi:23S rRNA (uridine2552-2'-O)-methyltransferase
VAAKRGSSRRWLQRQKGDPYVDRAAREGRRSRAAFKLEQIQPKERSLHAGMHCLDLGASPGGWSQYAARICGSGGRVWALDLLPMDPLPGVTFIHGDLTSESAVETLRGALGGRPLDLVMSDMAPNITGNRAVDQARSMGLAEAAMELSGELLRPGGDLLVKLFQGEGFDAFVRSGRSAFERVRLIKPKASRPASREIYLLARNYGM